MVLQNLATEMRFFLIGGTHRTLDGEKDYEEGPSLVEPVRVRFKPVPSPTRISSGPLFSEWSDRLLRSLET